MGGESTLMPLGKSMMAVLLKGIFMDMEGIIFWEEPNTKEIGVMALSMELEF